LAVVGGATLAQENDASGVATASVVRGKRVPAFTLVAVPDALSVSPRPGRESGIDADPCRSIDDPECSLDKMTVDAG
jgi:hypothetical protein